MPASEPDPQTISIVPTLPDYAEQMEDLSHVVYGSSRANPDGTLTAPHFRRHVELFPQGQFVALAHTAGGERVVGLTASMRVPFDPANPFIESWHTTISDGWLTRHDPAADWMYGVETCVHPGYRSRGVGGRLMEARFALAKALNLRGMVAGSAVISYAEAPDHVSPDEYVQGVIDGTYFDTNLTKQLRKGFRAVALIPNYLPDPETRGWGVVIVWENPDYDPARPVIVTPLPTRV
ncbi:MAG: GNAT family N-acetyltransferase [Anaerolineae bacterium]|nr:GNAT family N-acetyltransferase [Anaerolineae bacterium]